MEKLCKELDDAKAAMEKLVADNRIKTELSESLRKAHNEHLIKIKESNLVIEKQAQELSAKAEEISLTKQMYEDTKSSLQEKESALRHLRIANDKLRADSSEKLQKLGEENRELVFGLDEANTRVRDQEMKINALKEEIRGVKGLLSASQKKCSEAEEKAKAVKELRQKDDLVMKVEEENSKIKDQLKWKKEQFKHLEEAHEKVQDQFRVSKKEWEKEKCELLDKMCSLQTSLDSQTRIMESLQYQLQMCNQALAHEESRRKLLEVQMSESKMHYENVYSEYQEAKSKIESLTSRRDEDIAELRNLLSRKEALFKEAEYRRGHLEQENQELLKSLKELREAQIQEAGAASSMSKLRNKLRGLEQVHKECAAILKAREAEWSSQVESIFADLNECRSKLDSKDEQLKELQNELEGYQSSMMQLKLENSEMSVMLAVLKSGVSDAQSKLLSNSKFETESRHKEEEEQITLLKEQLEQKNNDLVRAHNMIEQERETAASLMRKTESLDPTEQRYLMTQKELERYKELLDQSNVQQLHLKEQSMRTENALKEEMRKVSEGLEALYLIEQKYLLAQNELERYKESIEEANAQQLHLKEQALQLQNVLMDELRKVSDDLDKVNLELSEKTNEVSEAEFELDRWKCLAESLRACVDENQEFRREMEASLLAQVETEQSLKQEKENLRCIAEEKEKWACELQQQIVLLEQDLMGRETEMAAREFEAAILAQMEAERNMEKDLTIEDLRLRRMSSEQGLTKLAKISALSELEGKQNDINTIHEAWQKIATVVVLNEVEIQEKNLVIVELEDELSSLQQKLDFQDKSFSCFKQHEECRQAELEAKQLEMEKEINELGSKLSTSEGLVEKLEFQKGLLLQDIMKVSSEKRDLLAVVEHLYDRISEFSSKDVELMGRMGSLVQSFDSNNEDSKICTEFHNADRENVNSPRSSSAKRVEAHIDGRSPLKERNN